MFFHVLKYKLLTCFRSKENLFWTFGFPLALGTFFFIAFSGITSKTEDFQVIPIAVVMKENTQEANTFIQVAKVIDENKQYSSSGAIIKSTGKNSGDNILFNIDYVSESNANKLLNKEKVDGIIYVNEKISVKI